MSDVTSNLIMESEESIMNDVNEINKLILDEKKNQEKDSKILTNQNNKKIEQDSNSKKVISTFVEDIETMERLHLRIVNDTIDILYRPNHCYISFVPNNEDGKNEVKRIALMSRDEFIEYLKKSSCFSFSSKRDIEEIKNSSRETWYKGAWSTTTKNLLKELGVENPIEEIIVFR